jgi:hypothetical protein
MNTIKIIETNKSHIIFENENGTISIEPNTPYFKLKLLEYKGERIRHDIPIEGIEILETFNGMIFNISLNGQTITTRPNMADEVVSSFNNIDKLYKIFNDYNNNKYNIKLLEGVLDKYGERVKTHELGFIIDDVFLVDRTGVAWNWKNGKRFTVHRTNLGSGAICIVVSKTQRLKLKTSNAGLINIDELGYIILSKIEFLLNPNPDDNVFMSQIPESTREIIKINN